MADVMRAALVQMTSTDIPAENVTSVLEALKIAKAGGADFVLTPEVTNCLSTSRAHQEQVLSAQEDDLVLAAVRTAAADLGLWVLIGSCALKTTDADGRFANRSLLISDTGDLVAHYDKIHMFDVDVSETETYRESEGYRPGDRAVTTQTPFGMLGFTICYDVRFPALHRQLAQDGAQILTSPAAFSYLTGQAHWETLLRARAIETGCFVLAPAQTGIHPSTTGSTRQTHGHSLAIAPWGEILLDAGTEPGVYFVDIDLDQVSGARRRVPSLTHDRLYHIAK